MSNYIFVFDLDSTITAEEILPKLAKLVNKEKLMSEITEETMAGAIPFKESFIRRCNLLSDLNVNVAKKALLDIKLNDEIVKFIRDNKERCYVITGNMDIWVHDLMVKIGIENHYFSSKGVILPNQTVKLISVINKKNTALQFIDKMVVVGDGSNDAEIIDMAEIGIGFGGVRNIAEAVLTTCQYAIYDQHTLVNLLRKLL